MLAIFVWVVHHYSYDLLQAKLSAQTAVLAYVVFVLGALLCLPGSEPAAACGFIFGTVNATLIASSGTVTAAALSRWLVQRHRRWFEVRFKRNAKVWAVYETVQQGSLRLLALMRLSPFLPLGPSNYVFGFLDAPWVKYLAATCLATLPTKLMWSHLGATGRQGLAWTRGEAQADELFFMVSGLAVSLKPWAVCPASVISF